MNETPQKEHAWLQKFVGEWNYSHECSMGPDQPASRLTGRETVRTLGGLWVVGESEGEMPDGGTATMVITIGYNPKTKRYLGSFVASMMTHMWIYDGEMDPDGKTIHLFAEGPNFCGGDGMVQYRDSVELVDDDHRRMTSAMRNADGSWNPFMTADYRRVK